MNSRVANPKTLPYKHEYDRFDLPFLRHEEGRVFNGQFDVTDAPEKLKGMWCRDADLKMSDYLVYRPLPTAILKWKSPPKVHPQSYDMETFYRQLVEACTDGLWVDGEFYNPLFIYWLNVFVFSVYKLDDKGDPIEDFDVNHPFYCNIDRYYFDYIWKAVINRKDGGIVGGRGIGKSFLEGCVIDREYRLFPKSDVLVSSTNDEVTDEAWTKVEECIESVEKLHFSLKHRRDKSDSGVEKVASIKFEDKDGNTGYRGFGSKIRKIVYGSTPGKTRGKRPTLQLIEEFMSFPPANHKGSLGRCLTESRGSWYVGASLKKSTVLFSGTGGTANNEESKDLVLKPDSRNILGVTDFSDNPHMLFVPTHVKRTGTWEKTGCPDVALGHKETMVEREEAKESPQTLMGLKQEYPVDLHEIFLRTGINDFNTEKLAQQQVDMEFGVRKYPTENGFLSWVKDKARKIIGVKWTAASNGPFVIYEHPEWVTNPEDYKDGAVDKLYIAGVDGIDQGNLESSAAVGKIKGSELGMLVKKRMMSGRYFSSSATSNLYVAKYVKRSDRVVDDWDNALKLAYYYNSKVNLEHTKIGIVSHFRSKGFYDILLKRPTINLSSPDPLKETQLIGTTTGATIIKHQDDLVAEYVEEYHTEIPFLDLVIQLVEYDKTNRTKFDLVIAMGLCELADENYMGKMATNKIVQTEGFVPRGYYTDENGVKRYGVIPEKRTIEDELQLEIGRIHKYEQFQNSKGRQLDRDSHKMYT